jgi:SPIRAL1-like protein
MTQSTLELDIQAVLKAMMIPDLRQELRARGLSPAGSITTLRERLGAEMAQRGSASLQPAIVAEADAACNAGPAKEAVSGDMGVLKNNYVRPEGQNVGNFITDRPSSRVLAPPGGGSNISLG